MVNIIPAPPPLTSMDTGRIVKALESIAGSLASFQKPAKGDGLLQALNRIADALEKLAAK